MSFSAVQSPTLALVLLLCSGMQGVAKEVNLLQVASCFASGKL